MRRVIAIVCLSVLLIANPVYADDVSHVLALYGHYEPLDIEKEKTALNKMLTEYYTMAKTVSNIEMSQIAATINEEQYSLQLASREKEAVEKEAALYNIEAMIFKSAEASVEELLALEAEYLKTERDLADTKERLEQLMIAKSEVNVEVSNVSHLKAVLNQKSIVVKNKKSLVERASSFPEIGEKQIKEYPLGAYSYITSDFGNRIDPITKESTQFHAGLDLHAAKGTQVICAYNGVIEKAGFDNALGHYVIVDHGRGLKTIYGHLDSYIVKTGDSVTQYQHIAYSGDSGSRSTGPHLHFGVYIYGEPSDPKIIVKR